MLFSWWKSQTIGTWLTTRLHGEAIGTDGFGNRYYQSSKGRRWVIYNGTVEASRVPPEWHGWLHHTFAEPPTRAPLKTQGFEAPHQPNLTGTPGAYRPDGSLSRGGIRPAATGDYQAWKSGMTASQTRETLIGAAVVAVAALALAWFSLHGGVAGAPGYPVNARMAKVDGLGIGTEVRVAGIKVGSVTAMDLDPATYLVTVHMRIRDDIKLPTDSSMMINSAGVLGASYLSVTPGGDDKMIAAGGAIENTQSANTSDIMSAVGRFTTGSGQGK